MEFRDVLVSLRCETNLWDQANSSTINNLHVFHYRTDGSDSEDLLLILPLSYWVSVFTSLSLRRWRMEEFWVESVLDRSGMRLLKPSLSSSTFFSSA